MRRTSKVRRIWCNNQRRFLLTTTIQSTQERLRQFFKYLNRFMLLMWRLGFGSYMNRPELSGRIMVLTHNGRKTGLRRQTPVNFAIVDGEVYCVARPCENSLIMR